MERGRRRAARALLGALSILYREQFRRCASTRYRIGVTVGTALILAGAVLWFGVDMHSGDGDPSAGNPVDGDRGVDGSGARCCSSRTASSVTGLKAAATGPQADSLDPAPADFRQHLPLHTDPQFFAFIADGIAGTAMPAWRDAFSDEDIWNMINYPSDVPGRCVRE